jgi:hypothetical protein
MLLTLNKLCELTGKDRKTVAPRLADVPFKSGPNKSHLYESAAALAAIFAPAKVSLDEARTRQALSQERLNNTRDEDLRKKRIPIEIPLAANDQVMQSVGSTLKAKRGKELTTELINEILEKFRGIPAKLKW